MTKIVLDPHATAKIKSAIEYRRLIKGEWSTKNGECLLGTLVTDEELAEQSHCCAIMDRGLRSDAIREITTSFDGLSKDKIDEYALRFAKIAERPVDYDLALQTASETNIPYIDALERQINGDTQ